VLGWVTAALLESSVSTAIAILMRKSLSISSKTRGNGHWPENGPLRNSKKPLGVFQGLDAPISISEEGMIEFMDRIRPHIRQKRRERLLDVSADDLHRVTDLYLRQPLQKEQASSTILGHSGLQLGPSWTTKQLDLGAGALEDQAAALQAMVS